MLTRWPFLLLGTAAGAALGAAAGIALHKPLFSISVSLLRRPIPSTVQTGEVGQAYRPSELNDATLLATLLAKQPLDRAVSRADNGLTPDNASSRVEASQLSGTDIFYVTYHSPLSAEDAVSFAGIWVDEINRYTQDLQRAEARATRQILQAEVGELDSKLANLDREILEFSQNNQFLGTDTQVAAILGQAGQVRVELANARVELTAKDAQIEKLTEELRKQSPLDTQLKIAREDLAQLRSTYTDRNPLVQAKLQSIAFIENQLATIESGAPPPLEFFTGSDIGNQLFLEILAYRNERLAIAGKVEAFAELEAELTARIASLPAIVSRFDGLNKRRAALIESRTLLGNRLEEAKIFASSAPGYWQDFQPADPRDVTAASPLKKPILLGAAGSILGTGTTLVLLVLLTSRTPRRSVFECCGATGTRLLQALEINKTDDFDTLWLSHLAPLLEMHAPVLIWTAHASPSAEATFWQNLAAAATRDDCAAIPFLDLDPSPSSPPQHPFQHAAEDRPPAILRTRSLPPKSRRDPLAPVTRWFAIAEGEKSALRAAAVDRAASPHLPPCHGTIALLTPPKGKIRQLADQLSILLTQQLSKPKSPPTESESSQP